MNYLIAGVFLFAFFLFFLSLGIKGKLTKNTFFFRVGSSLASVLFLAFASVSLLGIIL